MNFRFMIGQQIDEKYHIWQKMRLLGKFHGVYMDQYFGHMVHIFSLVIQLNPAKISFQLHFQSKIDVFHQFDGQLWSNCI